MKVLIFSLSYHPKIGGAEVAINEITARIPKEEIEFDMVTLRFSHEHPKFERINNVNVYRIGGGLGYFSKVLFIPQAAAFTFGKKYDLYWAMMTYMLFPISIARILGDRTPYVLTLQDGDPFTHVFNRLRIIFFKPLLSLGFRHAHKVQTISNFLAGWARQAGAKGSVEVIPNGVDVEKFSNSNSSFQSSNNPDEKVLITTSRLVEKNGVGDVIKALTLLPQSVRFKILGVGELEAKLKKQVKESNLEERVDFLGFVPPEEIPKHLHAADIFIRPSLSEGMGISFIEAMAAGLPVIATPVGGIPDFLKDSETGVFCEPNNPQSIATAVTKLINDQALAVKVKENALKMVKEHYGWDLIAKEMKRRVFVKV